MKKLWGNGKEKFYMRKEKAMQVGLWWFASNFMEGDIYNEMDKYVIMVNMVRRGTFKGLKSNYFPIPPLFFFIMDFFLLIMH
jgi:hypothetical protein